MRHSTLQLMLILIVSVSLIEGQRWSSYNTKQNTRSSAYHADGSVGKSTEKSTPERSQQSKPSRGGIGAWGYVAITLTVILSGLGVYYFVIFYPIVCKKERMYDVMEMTTV